MLNRINNNLSIYKILFRKEKYIDQNRLSRDQIIIRFKFTFVPSIEFINTSIMYEHYMLEYM